MSENLFRYGRMKSFKAKLLSAWAFAAPAFSAILPRDNSVARVGGHHAIVNLGRPLIYRTGRPSRHLLTEAH